jgi:hypothetical protein
MNDGDDGDNDEAAAELTEVTGENSMEPRCNYSEFGICVLLLGLLCGYWPRCFNCEWMYAWGGETFGHQARSDATPYPPF